MVFIYAVANIFIAIIEDSYFTVKGSTNGDIPRGKMMFEIPPKNVFY